MTAQEIRRRLRGLANTEYAAAAQRFFKTGPGEYGEGDVFLGIRVPQLRKLARECDGTTVAGARRLLRSKFHEERLLALFILVRAYARGGNSVKRSIYDLYLENTRYINNWDLVDASAEHIVGAFLNNRSKAPLRRLAQSQLLWERRIAVLSTFHYIKQNEFEHTLEIAELLIADDEDLIHKAVGWMLREIGGRDLRSEEKFLRRHYRKMPRTMLRYAIEKFPESKRQRYLKGKILSRTV